MAKKKESKQKKMNVRVDFTPMVDMLMLLITFFMLCTTLSKPSTMELFMPSNDENIQEEDKQEAKASEAVTIYVCADNKLYYGEGVPEYNNPDWLKETSWYKDDNNGIRDVLMNHQIDSRYPVRDIIKEVIKLQQDREAHPEKYNDSIYQAKMSNIKGGDFDDGEKHKTLTIVIKPTDNATYANIIDALDEMQILSIGTYVIDKISPEDQKLLESKGVKM